jgi:hypothetical protein
MNAFSPVQVAPMRCDRPAALSVALNAKRGSSPLPADANGPVSCALTGPCADGESTRSASPTSADFSCARLANVSRSSCETSLLELAVRVASLPHAATTRAMSGTSRRVSRRVGIGLQWAISAPGEPSIGECA